MNFRVIFFALGLTALGGCGSVAPIPEPQFFRMPGLSAPTPADAAISDYAIWIDAINASSLYAERPVVYATKPEAVRLRQYHYQYWVDPAPTQLRQRLMNHVRLARLSDHVSERPPEVDRRIRVSGFLYRFDRVRTDAGWLAVVELELKAEVTGTGEVLVRSSRAESEPADGDRMENTVAAFSRASDRAIERFVAELQTALPRAAAD
jgi:uncharacterized lipoprotein YmbA